MTEGFKRSIVPAGFKYPQITQDHTIYGATQMPQDDVLPSGDWSPFDIPDEEQKRFGTESSACFIEAQQHADAMYQEAIYGQHDRNSAARFNALLANGTKDGGDPLQGADSIRHDGLVPEDMMPFDEKITSWEDYHSFKGVNEAAVRAVGKKDTEQNDRRYTPIFGLNETYENKIDILRREMRKGTCAVSVTAWFEKDGLYYKPAGLRDWHFVAVRKVNPDNSIEIKDTYEPFIKTLAPGFNPDFAMRRVVLKKPTKEEQLIPLYQKLILLLKEWLGLLQNATKPPTTPVAPPNNPTPTPPPNNLLNAFCLAIQHHEGGRPQDLNIRLHNPGACRFSSIGYLAVYGKVTEYLTGNEKPGQRGFAKFETYEKGFLYLKNLVRIKAQKHPGWNLYDFFGNPIEGWAPDSDNNNSRRYAQAVGKELGVDPQTFLIARLSG